MEKPSLPYLVRGFKLRYVAETDSRTNATSIKNKCLSFDNCHVLKFNRLVQFSTHKKTLIITSSQSMFLSFPQMFIASASFSLLNVLTIPTWTHPHHHRCSSAPSTHSLKSPKIATGCCPTCCCQVKEVRSRLTSLCQVSNLGLALHSLDQVDYYNYCYYSSNY